MLFASRGLALSGPAETTGDSFDPGGLAWFKT